MKPARRAAVLDHLAIQGRKFSFNLSGRRAIRRISRRLNANIAGPKAMTI